MTDKLKVKVPTEQKRSLANAILALLAVILGIGLTLTAQVIGHYLGLDPATELTAPVPTVAPFSADSGHLANHFPTINGLSVHGILLDQVMRVTIDGMELYILAAPAP